MNNQDALRESPLVTAYSLEEDQRLVKLSLSGDRESLTQLIDRHQPFIYNIALKMVNNVPDAQDVTQEVLIKLITNLSKYDVTKAKFTTWLYRIVVNHILNLKKVDNEERVPDIEAFFNAIGSIEETAMTELEQQEMQAEIEEGKISCMSGMLMCLDRDQRLVYILGELFHIDHKLGAEVFEISPANFRQKVSRARKDLHHWMHNRCGLVNKANPCRCAKKTKGFIKKGWLDPQKLKWNDGFEKRIHNYARQNIAEANATYDELYIRLYQEHPFKIPQKANTIMDQILKNKSIRETLWLDE